MKATIKIINDNGTSVEGSYTENWVSPETWRTEITAGDFRQTEVVKGRRLWALSTMPLLPDFISPRITYDHEHLLAFHLDGNWLVQKSWKPSKLEDRTSASWSLRCIVVNNPFGWKSELCFDRPSGAIVAQSSTKKDAPYACTYTNYQKFDGKLFPRSIQCFREGKTALQASVIELKHLSSDPALFTPMPGARELSHCPSGGTSPYAQFVEQMSFPPNKFVVVSFTVGADSKPRDMTVLQSSGGSLDEYAMSHLKRWIFVPATCDGKAVDSEMQLMLPNNGPVIHGVDTIVRP